MATCVITCNRYSNNNNNNNHRCAAIAGNIDATHMQHINCSQMLAIYCTFVCMYLYVYVKTTHFDSALRNLWS